MASKRCSHCHGIGTVHDFTNDNPYAPGINCPICHGSGRVPDYLARTPPNTQRKRVTGRPAQRASTSSRPIIPPIIQSDVKKYNGDKFLFMRHGKGTAQHRDGLRYDGKWTFGKWSGKGSLYRSGTWVYEGRFKDGMLHGKGMLSLDNGMSFEGRFHRSVPKGKGVLKFANGSRFEGTWADTDSAKGKYVDTNGNATSATLQSGELTIKTGFFTKKKRIAVLDFREIFQGNLPK
jgi:hypothetical protein